MRKKNRIVHSAGHLDAIIKSDVLRGFTVWSDGSATVVLGWTSKHIEVTQDIWEEFNLKYNIYSY